MLQNNKVQEVTLISAKTKVDNANDAARAYNIEADVTSTVSEVGSIEAGKVKDKETGIELATFNEPQHSGGNIYFNGTNTTAEKRAITGAVYDFIDNVKAMYANPNNE